MKDQIRFDTAAENFSAEVTEVEVNKKYKMLIRGEIDTLEVPGNSINYAVPVRLNLPPSYFGPLPIYEYEICSGDGVRVTTNDLLRSNNTPTVSTTFLTYVRVDSQSVNNGTKTITYIMNSQYESNIELEVEYNITIKPKEPSVEG